MVDWEDGELAENGYVEINGIRYPVIMPVYQGRTPVSAENLLKMQSDLQTQIDDLDSNKVNTKNQITYANWQNVILTRSDSNFINLILYSSNLLKEGTYSLANDFKLYCVGTTEATITIPKAAVNSIVRYDWGFELLVQRSLIPGTPSGNFNGIAIAHDGPLTLQSN